MKIVEGKCEQCIEVNNPLQWENKLNEYIDTFISERQMHFA